MRINPLNSVLLFSSSMHDTSHPVTPTAANHSMPQAFQNIPSSLLEMWLPMFIAMAIRIPIISGVTKFIRIPLEVLLKAFLALGLSEIMKFFTRKDFVHNY